MEWIYREEEDEGEGEGEDGSTEKEDENKEVNNHSLSASTSSHHTLLTTHSIVTHFVSPQRLVAKGKFTALLKRHKLKSSVLKNIIKELKKGSNKEGHPSLLDEKALTTVSNLIHQTFPTQQQEDYFKLLSILADPNL